MNDTKMSIHDGFFGGLFIILNFEVFFRVRLLFSVPFGIDFFSWHFRVFKCSRLWAILLEFSE